MGPLSGFKVIELDLAQPASSGRAPGAAGYNADEIATLKQAGVVLIA